MNKKLIRLTEQDLHRIVKESVNRILREDKLDKVGHYLDLDQTSKAYDLGGVGKHWTDYSNDEDGWDEDAYYSDFDKWWDSLSPQEKNRIYQAVKY